MKTGAIVVAALMIPASAQAQAGRPESAPAAEHRLSPQQIETVLAEAANKREAAERRLDPGAVALSARPQVHGEVGFSVGTGGYREVFGTAIHPLGDDGAAAISLDFIDLGKRRYKR